ncbi:MAG: YHS domain-containing (seleno)protein [Gemmatimonadota bacterium]
MRTIMNRIGVLVLLGLLATGSALAQVPAKVLLNLDKSGVALEGYDPVTFFSSTTPVKGQPALTSQWHGATYRFSSATNKRTFDDSPTRYTPQFGGYCAYAASKGHTAPVEIDAYEIVDGRLLMQNSKSVRERFNKDAAGNLRLADSNWPAILEREGKGTAH